MKINLFIGKIYVHKLMKRRSGKQQKIMHIKTSSEAQEELKKSSLMMGEGSSSFCRKGMKSHPIFPKDRKHKKSRKGQQNILASKHMLRPTNTGGRERRKASWAPTIIYHFPEEGTG